MKTNTFKQTKNKLTNYILCAVLAVTALFAVLAGITFGGKNTQASAATYPATVQGTVSPQTVTMTITYSFVSSENELILSFDVSSTIPASSEGLSTSGTLSITYQGAQISSPTIELRLENNRIKFDKSVFQYITKAGSYMFNFTIKGPYHSPTSEYNYLRFSIPFEPLALPADPVKAGYTFVGWYYDTALTKPYTGGFIFADTDLYAKFTPISYSIAYTLNSGTMTGQATSYNIETATYTLPTPSRTGYTFGGWYENSNFSGTKVTQIAKGSTGNKTYYAQWTIISYAIIYNLNSGTQSGQTTSYTIETATYTLPTPTRTGYTFGGWFTSSTFSGTAVTEIAKGSTGDKTFYAKWNIVTYTITFNLNEGTLSGQPTTYTYESGVITLPTPTRTGYTFKGWFDNESFTGSSIPSIGANSTGNKTYNAKWEIKTHTVTFYVEGIIYKELIVTYGSSLAELYIVNTETMQAVTFFLDSELRNSFNPLNIIDDNLTVFTDSTFALYASLSYSVNGEIIATDLLTYNSQLSNLREAAKEGYVFGGWYYDENFTKAVNSTDAINSNITVYAKLTVIEPEEVIELTTWDKIWKVLKPILIYGGIGVGAAVIVGVVIKVVKKKKGK